MMAGSDSKCGEAGFFMPTDRCTMLMESSTELAWIPRSWWSCSVRPRQGRIRAFSPCTRWLRFSFVLTCTVSEQRRSQGEVAAHADEHFYPALVHGLDGVNGVHAVLARWVDAADFGQPVQELLRRAVVDTAGAVALDVAVSAHGRRAGALPAHVAAQQQHVDDFAHGVDAVLML